MLDHLTRIDISLAQPVAENLGIELSHEQMHVAPPKDVNGLKKDPSLSLYAVPSGSVKGRVVAILLSEKANAADVLAAMKALKSEGVHTKLLFARMGEVAADDGSLLPIGATFAGSPSVTVDAVIVPGGDLSSILDNGDAAYYLLEAYKHLKVIGLAGDARQFKSKLAIDAQGEEGVVEGDTVTKSFTDDFLKSLAAHRVWSRHNKIAHIPA
ncbi:Catalase HPII [compost metagenome]